MVEAALKDDIFHVDFLSGVVFICDAALHLRLQLDAVSLLRSYGNKYTRVLAVEDRIRVPAGPHIVSGGVVCPVWRLYEDTAGAFITSVRQISPQKSLTPMTHIHSPAC